MRLDVFEELVKRIPDFDELIADIDSQAELDARVDELAADVRRLYDNRQNVMSSETIPEIQKQIFLRTVNPQYEAQRDRLNALYQVKDHFDKYIADYNELLDVNAGRKYPEPAEARNRRNEIQEELDDYIKFIPESLRPLLNSNLELLDRAAEGIIDPSDLPEEVRTDGETVDPLTPPVPPVEEPPVTEPPSEEPPVEDSSRTATPDPVAPLTPPTPPEPEPTREDRGAVALTTRLESIDRDFERVLDGKEMEAIGLNEFEDLNKKYAELKERMKDFTMAMSVASRNHEIGDAEFRTLMTKAPLMSKKIDDRLKSILIFQEARESFKENTLDNIKKVEGIIEQTRNRIEELEKEIRLDTANGVEKAVIDAKVEKARELGRIGDQYRKQLADLKNQLTVIEKGGRIDKLIKVEELDPKALVVEGPARTTGPAPVPPLTPPTPPAPTPTPGAPAPGTPPVPPVPPAPGAPVPPVPPTPEVTNTIEGLVKKGTLPKFLKTEDLISICKAYGFNVDATTELKPEQIKVIKEDYEIQSAMLYQKIYERNQAKISEYDKIIAKYEGLLSDKINIRNFSPEYIKKVQDLLTKCKVERQKHVDKNKKYSTMTREQLANEFSGGAMDYNDNVRGKYQKIAEIQKEKASSKFKQGRNAAKIERIRKRINKLQSKKASIASQQQQIVNENAQKYIDKMQKQLLEFSKKQSTVEASVDQINALSDRLAEQEKEITALEEDISRETRFFDRMGLKAERRRQVGEARRLENALDDQDSIVRHVR